MSTWHSEDDHFGYRCQIHKPLSVDFTGGSLGLTQDSAVPITHRQMDRVR